MKDTLNIIIDFATQAHGTQKRKYTDESYIVHPVRVMRTCEAYTDKLSVLAAALLHDVLEDTDTTKEEMLVFLKQIMDHQEALKTLSLVKQLTDVYTKEDFPRLNRKQRKEKELERIIKTTANAQTIKYADILDNSREIIQHDIDFAPRYLKECLAVLKNSRKGNKKLYRKTLAAVEDNLAYLRSIGRN